MIRVLLPNEKEVLVGDTWDEILVQYRQGRFAFEADLSDEAYMQAAAKRANALMGVEVGSSSSEDFFASLDKVGLVRILSKNPVLH